MKLQECIEYLQSSLGGGVFTDETRTEIGFAEKMLAVGRAFCIKEMYRNQTDIHQIYYQTATLSYDADLQDNDCYNVFEYPNILNINTQLDGHSYMGGRLGDSSWRRVRSVAAWDNLQRARNRRSTRKDIYYLLEPNYGTVKVFDKNVKRALGVSIFEDPLHPLLNFNRQEDEYPITLECLQMMEQYFREGKFERFMRTPADIISNSVSENSLGGQPQQQ